jgi:DNA-binding NarL/FixJ family response regulator
MMGWSLPSLARSEGGYRGKVSQAVDRGALLAEARVAYGLRRYADAYRGLATARERARLPDDDLRRLADAAWWLGHVSECLALTEELHRHYLEQGYADRAAVQAIDLAGMFFMRGEPALGSGWLSRARKLLADQPRGAGHAMLMYVDLSGALENEQLDVATTGAAELQELGRELGDPTYVALGLLVEGLAEIRRGRLREGFGLLDEAMLPVVADTVAREFAGNIYCTIIAICEDIVDLARARQWTAATERWLESFTDAVMFQGVCRAHRVHLLATDGNWDKAEAEARQVVAELADLNNDAIAEAEYQLAETYRLRGRGEDARAAYDLAAARGRDPQPGAALLELSSGRINRAWAEITAAVAAYSAHPFRCAPMLRAQVEIGLAAGHLAAATSAYERLRRISETYPTSGFRAWADQAQGAVLVAAGDPSAALAPLQAAAAAYYQMRAPYDAACVELLLAEAHRLLGDQGDAEMHGDAAGALFARLGLPPPPSAQTHQPMPAGLTNREAEVLRLVASGASNREVGDKLWISEATVRRHLANIFRKLDVSSRTAASAWAHERGLLR